MAVEDWVSDDKPATSEEQHAKGDAQAIVGVEGAAETSEAEPEMPRSLFGITHERRMRRLLRITSRAATGDDG
eukprot:763901-Prymnesium_polylepis.1